jgi:hypothetical protein
MMSSSVFDRIAPTKAKHFYKNDSLNVFPAFEPESSPPQAEETEAAGIHNKIARTMRKKATTFIFSPASVTARFTSALPMTLSGASLNIRMILLKDSHNNTAFTRSFILKKPTT